MNEDLKQPQNTVMRGKKTRLSHFEGVVFDGFDDVSKEHLGRDCVAVVDDRLAVGPIPAV